MSQGVRLVRDTPITMPPLGAVNGSGTGTAKDEVVMGNGTVIRDDVVVENGMSSEKA